MVEEHASQLTTLLFLLAVVPTATFLTLEANIRVTIGERLRLYNAVDLAFLTLFYHELFRRLCTVVDASMRTEIKDRPERHKGYWSSYLASLLLLIFQTGRVIHITADAIHTYATEIHSYKDQLPQDLYELIYFLDEDLGHWLLFLPYFSVLALLTASYDAKPRSANRGTMSVAVTIFSGALMGATHAVAVIESSHPWLGVVGSMLLLLGSFRAWRRRSTLFSHPLLAFSSTAATTLIVGMILYRVAVGSFQEPSELGGVIRVAKSILTCTVFHFSFALSC